MGHRSQPTQVTMRSQGLGSVIEPRRSRQGHFFRMKKQDGMCSSTLNHYHYKAGCFNDDSQNFEYIEKGVGIKERETALVL